MSCPFTEVIIPPSVTTIEFGAFSGCIDRPNSRLVSTCSIQDSRRLEEAVDCEGKHSHQPVERGNQNKRSLQKLPFTVFHSQVRALLADPWTQYDAIE